MLGLLVVCTALLSQVDAAAFNHFKVTLKSSGTTVTDGDVPDEIVIEFNAPTTIAPWVTYLIVKDTGGAGPLFDGDVSSFTMTPTGLLASDISDPKYYQTGTYAREIELHVTGTLSAGSLYTISLSSPVGASFQAVDSTPYVFQVQVLVSNLVTDTDSYTLSILSGGGASGDPLTFWNGTKTKFWLPEKAQVPLLETPHLILWATALQGPDDLQWFQSFIITLPDHEFLARVEKFEPYTGERQLDVVVGKDRAPLRSGGLHITGTPLRLAMSDVQLQNNRVQGAKKTEYFFLETPELSFAIFSSFAGTEFPNDTHLQQKYQHLNFLPMDIADYSNFKGALPQMWGLVPMEAATSAMLIPPSEARRLAASAALCSS